MVVPTLPCATQTVLVGERPTRCLVSGNGPPLVLLHGNGTSADEWIWVLPRLAQRFRVYAPDLQHVPPRATPPHKPAPAFDVAFVLALLDALSLPSAILVGNSLGGFVALQTALAAPGRVRGLVLADSAGLGQAVSPALQSVTTPVYGELAVGWASTRIGSMQRAWGRAGLLFAALARTPAGWIASQYRLAQQPGFLAATLASLRAQVALGGQRRVLVAQLPRIVSPTLVLWGEHDAVVPVAHAHAALAQLPCGELELIAACGHLPHVEQPEPFARAVAHFIEQYLT
jgi:pimeloyl-ACP methyl ester carboxylesterase